MHIRFLAWCQPQSKCSVRDDDGDENGDEDDDESFQKFLHIYWQIDILSLSLLYITMIILCTDFFYLIYLMLSPMLTYSDEIILIVRVEGDIYNHSPIG